MPISQKRAAVFGELHRAASRSTDPTFKECSINMVMDRFRKNGYPWNFLNRCLTNFNSNRKRSSRDRPADGSVFLRVPFVNEAMKRKMINLTKRSGLGDSVKLCFSGGRSLKKVFHPPKEKFRCNDCDICKMGKLPYRCRQKFVVYQITCNLCQKQYIGETARAIGTRIKEHLFKATSYSAVQYHFTDEHIGITPSGNIQWEILHGRLFEYSRRRVMEGLHIYRASADSLINGCKGRFVTYKPT